MATGKYGGGFKDFSTASTTFECKYRELSNMMQNMMQKNRCGVQCFAFRACVSAHVRAGSALFFARTHSFAAHPPPQLVSSRLRVLLPANFFSKGAVLVLGFLEV